MCGGSNSDSDSGGGYTSVSDMFDGGGPGRSGARFSSGDTGGLDQNQDNYISEQEYQRGQSNAESNADRNITGEIGDAYNNSRGVVSNFSNSFGALPRGSIRQEAALGPQYGTPIETKNMARYLQMGGMPGAAIRGVSGFLNPAITDARNMAMAPVRAYRGEGAPPNPVVTPEQAARSYDSIFNTGERIVPQNVIQGTRSLNPRLGRPMAMSAPVPESSYYPNLIDDDPYSAPPNEVVLENGMYNFYENGQLVRQITEQEYNQMLMYPNRTA